MGDGYFGIGHNALDGARNIHDILNTVVYKENLSAARKLKLNSIADQFFVPGPYFGLNRVAVGWWRVDDAQVAGAHHRKLQCAGNRCCCQG